MKKLLILSAAILAGTALYGCLGGRTAANNTEQEPGNLLKMTLPEVPPMLSSPEERAEFMALHYWDNFDFADTTYIDQPEITEQAFADYLAITGVNSPAVVARSVSTLIDRSTADERMYRYFAELFEKYLYEYGSPLRSEDFYIVVLESILESDKVDELDKLRPQAQLTAALKNRVGTRAADIVLTRADGGSVRLYDIRADYTLLYFNNPDCSHCAELTGQITSSTDMLMPLVAQGVLRIVTVYPDEDLDAWHRHYDDTPSDWLRTYDKQLAVRRDQTYDVRAIPSLYLLDRDKTVLLKDVDQVWMVEQFFAMQGY